MLGKTKSGSVKKSNKMSGEREKTDLRYVMNEGLIVRG